MKLEDTCPRCGGTGKHDKFFFGLFSTCNGCSGKGVVLTSDGHKIVDLIIRHVQPTNTGNNLQEKGFHQKP